MINVSVFWKDETTLNRTNMPDTLHEPTKAVVKNVKLFWPTLQIPKVTTTVCLNGEILFGHFNFWLFLKHCYIIFACNFFLLMQDHRLPDTAYYAW